MKNAFTKLILFTYSFSLLADANWTRSYPVESPRANIYEWDEEELAEKVIKGRIHAIRYPVTVTELIIPYEPIYRFFELEPHDPVRKYIYKLTKRTSPFKSMKGLYSWLGLHDYPNENREETPNEFPRSPEIDEELPLGASLIQTDHGVGLTFGCATCHSSDLFGVKVLGLTNRFPRANEFFKEGSEVAPYVNSFVFKKLLQSSEGERKILVQAKKALRYVGVKKPKALGLDTSLAQVALSLAKRGTDPYAEKLKFSHRFPRKNKLETMVADSKPAVWWNLKYKNRWLSDGSIVSGNPVFTNFLWNEIGRGVDLHKLETWLLENQTTVEELTTAVFATEAPRYEKFFGPNSIDLQKAQRGEKHFIQSCQKCHGTYEKAWSLPESSKLSQGELIQTTRVTYHKETPVKNVGTDPGRYLGMREFADGLNQLAISKMMGTVVEPQEGYVPPPLVGIWSRWPYFHNNSIPNLCALLTPGTERPRTYWSGLAIDKNRDFDQECVGYPLGEKTPPHWKENKEHFYDTTLEGLSNKGHDERIFIKDGKEIFTRKEKLELIEFLKTL
jgi:mono/diheme cytochrome c family protein